MRTRDVYNNKTHGNPHRPSPAKILAKDKVQNAAAEAAEVVDADDDAQQAVARVVDDIEEVLVGDDAAEDALVVACSQTVVRMVKIN